MTKSRRHQTLSALRARSVADSLFPYHEQSGILKVNHTAENWKELEDSIRTSKYADKTAILALFG